MHAQKGVDFAVVQLVAEGWAGGLETEKDCAGEEQDEEDERDSTRERDNGDNQASRDRLRGRHVEDWLVDEDV